MQGRFSPERRFAEFYRLYIADFRHDVPLYLDLAGKSSGLVLEVGCRTGRVAAHLAAAGHAVHAIDLSRPMLEVAIEHLRPWSGHAQVYDFDLRAQALGQRFPLALVTLHSFNRLIDIEEQRLFLRHLRGSLTSPGRVALDLFCPLSMIRPEAANEWRSIERTVGGRRLQVRDRREMLTPLLERRTQVFWMDDKPCEEVVTHRRYVPPGQMRELLAEAGFERARGLVDYDPSTLAPLGGEGGPRGPYLALAEV
ncbi:MAG: methyltransferase [Myxococcota bacterium]